MALQDPPASLGTLGNYDLVEKLGEGSMGTAYRARHWITKEVVAVKVMPSHIARKPMLLKRFEQEFRIASKVHHPNVVRAMEYIGRGDEPYLVMEFVNGVALGDRLDREGRMAEDEAVRLIAQIAEGLAHAHDLGLLHRDVKPDNILVTADGLAKLADLGLGKEIDGAEELTRTGSGLGTPNFMAPEQFRNAKNADARCDVYSLAATLYQMVTGELPFGSGDPVRILMRKLSSELTPPRELAPELSERTAYAIVRGMRPEMELRTPSCRRFLEDLLGESASTDAAAPEAPADEVETDLAQTHRGTPVLTKDTATVRRSLLNAQLKENAAQAAAPPAPQSAVPTWRTPAPAAPASTSPAPASTQARPPQAMRSEKYLLRTESSTQPNGDPYVPGIPPPSFRFLPENWKTAVIVGVTCAATMALGQVLFALLK